MITNIVTILYRHAETKPDTTALKQGKQSVTFAGLALRARQCAARLHAAGIGEGDRVLVFVPLSINLYALLLAIWHCGASAVFLDAWARKKRLEQAAAIAECKAFVGTARAHLLRLFSAEIRKIPVKLSADSLNKSPGYTVVPMVSAISDDTLALITFTTGSTGVPKAAKRTHAFLLAQHEVLTSHLTPREGDIDMVTLPIFVLTNLAAGITSYIPPFNPAAPETVDPEKLYRGMVENRVTTSAGSPIIYQKLAEYCVSRNREIPTLKKIFLGGAPVFPQAAALLTNAFPHAAIKIVFGSTEAEPISAIRAEELIARNQSVATEGLLVGKPIDAISVTIIRITDGPITVGSEKQFNALILPRKEIGEICVRGKHVLKEYFRNEEAQKQNKIIIHGTIMHRTGDAGYIDKDNNLYLMGRTKQRFTYEGAWRYLFPLEASLSAVNGIQMGTYVYIGDSLLLVIEPAKKVPCETYLRDYCRENNMPVPDTVLFTKIPRDPRHNSKIDYGLLKQNIHRLRKYR
jgi:acyl-CoA synthetase (AMP-forming)/AMP-acid ligase II